MKCQDVRRAFPHLVAGEIPLTEWAILETHMAKCPACRQELERQEVEAVQRERLRRRSATAAALVASAVLLAVAGGGFYIYEASQPDSPSRPTFLRMPLRPLPPPVTVTPAAPPPVAPASAVARPVPAPAPAPQVPRARPVVEATPSPARPSAPAVEVPRTRPVVEAAPSRARPSTPVAEVPRPARAAPTPGAAHEERMPTQGARPSTVVNAAPGAEAMPTQGVSRRPRE